MSGGAGSVPRAYNPSGSPMQDQQEQGLLNNLYPQIGGSTNNLAQNLQNSVNDVLTNPYAQDATNTAVSVSHLGGQIGNQAIGNAQRLYDAGNQGIYQISPQQRAAANQLFGNAASQNGFGSQLIDTQLNQLLPQQLQGAQQVYGDANRQNAAGSQLIDTQMGQLLPQQLQEAQQLAQMAQQLQQKGGSLLNTTFGTILPQDIAAGQQALKESRKLGEYGDQTLKTEYNQVLPGQLAASQAQYGLGNMDASLIPQLYQSAFDPQQALYSRDMSKLLDMTNAQSAQSGLGGSPFAAGLANDSARNFQIDWENQQLSRQLAGAQGIAGMSGAAQSAFQGGANTAGNAMTGALNTMAGAYAPSIAAAQAGTGMMNAGADTAMGVLQGAYQPAQQAYMNSQTMQNNATGAAEGIVNNAYTGAQNSYGMAQGLQNSAMGAASNMVNHAYDGAQSSIMGGNTLDQSAMQTLGQSADLYGGALSMGQSGLNTAQTAGLLPYETQNAISMQKLGALGAQADTLNAAYSPTFNYATAANNYMDVGQGAVKLNQAAQQQQFNQNQATMAGLGSIAGSLFNVASNPFSMFGNKVW